MAERMLVRTPAMTALMAITVATPITMPRLVRKERALFARTWSRARRVPSWKLARRIGASARRPARVRCGCTGSGRPRPPYS